MFVLRPSSALKLAQRGLEPERGYEVKAPPEIAIQEPFIDRGLPLPETYDVDIIRAMLQDPFRIFIYWEVRDRSLRALTRYFAPDEAQAFRTTLKLTEIGGGHEVFFDVHHKGRYWLQVFPDREYEFEIGVRSPAHGYISLVRSNRVQTPRGTVSPERARESDYQLSPRDFVEILEATGFGAQQTFDVTLAAMAEPEAATANDEWADALLKLPEAVHKALTLAAAGGELTLALIADLPEPLRGELMKLLLGGDGRIAAAGLMHYLPELLHEAGRESQGWIGDPIHPLHLTPRFMLGGTENVALPGGEIRWPALSRRPSSF